MQAKETNPGYFVIRPDAGDRAEVAAQRLRVTDGIVFVTLAQAGQIDLVTAAEHSDLFSPWTYPAAYGVGDLRCYDGRLYRCVQAHTSQADWTPETAASLWTAAADPTDPWPQWSQPVGAYDAYGAGNRVTHSGGHWISLLDGNVWEPGVYGWEAAQ